MKIVVNEDSKYEVFCSGNPSPMLYFYKLIILYTLHKGLKKTHENKNWAVLERTSGRMTQVRLLCKLNLFYLYVAICSRPAACCASVVGRRYATEAVYDIQF